MKDEQLYCKHCDTSFHARIATHENRGLMIECPLCHWKHPRQFEAGVAVHCNVGEMTSHVDIRGRR